MKFLTAIVLPFGFVATLSAQQLSDRGLLKKIHDEIAVHLGGEQLPPKEPEPTQPPPTPPTSVIIVHDGTNLQQVLDSAPAGSVISLVPGAIFTGHFVVRQNDLTLRSETQLPESRVTPAQAGTLAVGPRQGLASASYPLTTDPAFGATPRRHRDVLDGPRLGWIWPGMKPQPAFFRREGRG
jgi:hypothetical protein